MARDIPDLIKSYKIEVDATSAQRLAHFLNEAAKALPRRFVDRRYCAKVAFALKQVPVEKSDNVVKLGKMSSSVRKLLEREYGRALVLDKIHGWRASADADDQVENDVRTKVRRHASSTKALEKSVSLVDQAKVKSPALKKELLNIRKNFDRLLEFRKNVPLLTAGGEKIEDKEKEVAS